MGILKNFGGYKIFVTCPNCGFGSEIRVTRGLSVAANPAGTKLMVFRSHLYAFPSEGFILINWHAVTGRSPFVA